MATIGDVAKLAGVSRSTVSSVITGKKYVTPTTRARVEDAIHDLRFTVNSGARALATSRTMTIGLVFSIGEPQFVPSSSTYVMALAEEARIHGYRLTLVTGADSGDELVSFLATKSVDGLVLMDVVEQDPRIPLVRRAGIPAVLVGMPSDSDRLDAVDLDYTAAGVLAVDQVHGAGARHPAVVTWPRSLHDTGATYARRFLEGVLSRSGQLGFDLTPQFCDASRSQVETVILPVLRDPDVDSLIFHNDALVPILPMLLLREHREALTVIGPCPPELAGEQWLPFDTIDTQPVESAQIAIRLLVHQLTQSGKDNDPAATSSERILLPPRLTPRTRTD